MSTERVHIRDFPSHAVSVDALPPQQLRDSLDRRRTRSRRSSSIPSIGDRQLWQYRSIPTIMEDSDQDRTVYANDEYSNEYNYRHSTIVAEDVKRLIPKARSLDIRRSTNSSSSLSPPLSPTTSASAYPSPPVSASEMKRSSSFKRLFTKPTARLRRRNDASE